MNKGYNELNFQELTPNTIENMDYYKEALSFAFKNPNILNIAVTGAYGAGKSSVIKTYKNLHKEMKFIHISLTNFEKINSEQKYENVNNEKSDDNTRDKRDKKLDEGELEGKILNQLIYQIDSKNIPQTKFKVKKDIKKTKIIKETLAITLFLLSLLYVFKFKELTNFLNNIRNSSLDKYLIILSKNETFVLLVIVCFFIIIYYLYRITMAQLYNPIFKKIKWQNNEIEIFEKEEESYFNKHMDEILYLFRNSNVDVIVFEDIDRYNNNIIFSKLREINALINNEINNKNQGKSIRFLYLIRDDIFSSKDRTKFFDFILPVIPVIDSSNSYDKILEHFSKAGPLNINDKTFIDKLDDFYLRDISLYIDDMRLLKNIYNEYVIYYGRLQTIELDPNKLLALIIYKNIFPKDFIDLQLNKGLVFEIIANKELYIKERKSKIDLEVQKRLDNIIIIKHEFLNDLDELDTLYITSGQTNYHVDGKFDNKFKSRLEYIKEIKNPNKRVVLNGYEVVIENVILEFNKNPDYIERKKVIEQKMSKDLERIEEELIKLRQDKDEVSSLKLEKIISKDNISYIFKEQFKNTDDSFIKYEDIINNHYYPLIKYLIKNGHIDETYSDYLSYFYENGLSRNDKIFLRSITDEDQKEFNYKLKDAGKVITYLKPISMKQKEALNFDLLNYLLDNSNLYNNQEYLSCILQQIKDNQNFDFVWSYIEQASNIDKLIKKLNAVWKEICVYLTSNSQVEDKKKKDYMVYTLHYSDLEEIQDMNIGNCISTYISTNENFLNIDCPEINRIISIFASLEICFININYDFANKDLFQEIYNNNLYELNLSMIKLILEKVYNIPTNSDYIEKNYTFVSSQAKEPLKNYIDKKINDYMELLFANLSNKFKDSEDIVINILNNSEIKDDKKIKYIQHLGTTITNVNDIENTTMWEELFKNNVADYSTENILNYYFKYSGMIDSIITEFLNSNPKELLFEYEIINKNYGENVSKFFVDVITNNELINEKYEMILGGYNQVINSFNYNNINEDKFEILIKLGILGMTKENINFVRNTYPNSMMFFAIKNIKEYIDCVDVEILNEQEIINLLNVDIISDTNKIKLVNILPSAISIEGGNYSENLKLFIIKNKFNSDDLKYLIDNYENSSPKMKQAIKEICIVYSKEISENEYQLPYDLISVLMQHTEIEENNKKTIVCNSIVELNYMKVKELMIIAGFNDFASLFMGRRPLIEITNENHNLLENFKTKKFIKNYIDNKDGYYRAMGRYYK